MAITYRQMFDIDWNSARLVITKMKIVTSGGGGGGTGPWLSLGLNNF